jgi:hypothetical protein
MGKFLLGYPILGAPGDSVCSTSFLLRHLLPNRAARPDGRADRADFSATQWLVRDVRSRAFMGRTREPRDQERVDGRRAAPGINQLRHHRETLSL